MKIKNTVLTQVIPVSSGTLNRYIKTTSFPRPEKIGREYYHDESAIYDWLNSRIIDTGVPNNDYKVKSGDKLLGINAVSKLLGRSTTWIWSNITKSERFTSVDLSPSGNSDNPRRYFIEREIKEEFSQLIEINKNNEVL